MNKINRTIVSVGLALAMLWMVLPTLSTASADTYSSSGNNTTAQDVAIGTGVVVVGGTIIYLLTTNGSSNGTANSGE